jgi:hypothetical protein
LKEDGKSRKKTMMMMIKLMMKIVLNQRILKSMKETICKKRMIKRIKLRRKKKKKVKRKISPL